MYLDQISAATPDTSLIARHGLAAAQWEAVLADGLLERETRAWSSPPLTTFSRWLADRWELARQAGSSAHDRCLLSAAQSARLWQRVIEESPEGAGLISPARVATWAQLARQTLHEHGLSSAALRQSPEPGDSAAFQRWNRRFDQALDNAGWIDPESLLFRLNRLPVEQAAGAILLLDPAPIETPERLGLRTIWRAAGRGITDVYPETDNSALQLTIASDFEDELRQAGEWAARLIEDGPRTRVAVVVPDLDARSAETERIFVSRLGPGCVSNSAGRALRDTGVIGAALNALLLLSPRADFGALSRWLRSPFFATADDDRRRQAAVLECRLRSDVRSQQGFLDAYRAQGLRAELRRRLPDATARIDAVLERLPQRATPSRWVELWQSGLKTLGWRGIVDGLESPLAEAWDRTLATLAELTPVTGVLDMPAALDELERVVGAVRVGTSPRLQGVHLLHRIGDVGPGFAGAWVTGFSEQGWPEAPPPNPLVPWSLQIEHGMPAARPGTALAAAAAELDRLRRRVPALVLSCPDRILDQPQVPHPRFSGWKASSGAASRRAAAVSFAASRIGARQRETLGDPAPALRSRHLPGGARTLDLQSACPLQAFCESRLGVRALEPALRGIDGRLRGILLHRILELLYQPQSPAAGGTALDEAVAAACAELLPRGDACWQAQVEAERGRVSRLLAAWLEAEGRRIPFRTIAVEQRTVIDIDGWQLGSRIDRLDRLESGDELLVDYKSGKRPTTRWRDERLGDCQLPLYTQRPGPEVAAIVLAVLNDEGVGYRALGRRADSVPGTQTILDDAEWQAQLARWREQLLTLIEEFAAGDVRVRADGADLDGTAWAMLARTARIRR